MHFAADVAATRAVLEAGLPELAGALREAGLTLVGGGVFGRARRNGSGTTTTARRAVVTAVRGEERPARLAATPSRVLRRARGVVDLFA